MLRRWSHHDFVSHNLRTGAQYERNQTLVYWHSSFAIDLVKTTCSARCCPWKNWNNPWIPPLYPSLNFIGPVVVFTWLDFRRGILLKMKINTRNDRFSFVVLRLLGPFTVRSTPPKCHASKSSGSVRVLMCDRVSGIWLVFIYRITTKKKK